MQEQASKRPPPATVQHPGYQEFREKVLQRAIADGFNEMSMEESQSYSGYNAHYAKLYHRISEDDAEGRRAFRDTCHTPEVVVTELADELWNCNALYFDDEAKHSTAAVPEGLSCAQSPGHPGDEDRQRDTPPPLIRF